MYFKVIIQGRLEFGNKNSYDKVHKMFLYRVENYYKNDVVFRDPEEIFQEEGFTLHVPRHVGQITAKSYKNTVSLFEYCAQFAVSGVIRVWMVETGVILKYAFIEPSGDKAAVQQFLKGRNLVKAKGRQEEALEALTKAIEKYNRHAQAYERRAKVNFILKNYSEAIRDYTKSIAIDDSIPTAYYGRGKVYIIQEEFDKAIADFEMAIKKAVAVQPTYWKARRLKGNCHMAKKEYDKAALEFKLFLKRKFEEDNPNVFYRRGVHLNYAQTLVELGEYEEAIVQATAALEHEDNESNVNIGKIYRFRGLAKMKAGKKDYAKDLKEAINLGDKIAQNLLDQ